MIKLVSTLLPKSITDNLRINKLPVLFAALLIVLIRLFSDTFYFLFNTDNNITYIIWQILSSCLIILFSFVYFIPNNYLEENELTENNTEYFKNINNLIFLNLFVVIVSIFNTDFIFKTAKIQNFITLLFVDFISPIILIANLINCIFIWKWLNIFKHSKTYQLFIVLLFSVTYMFLSYLFIFIKDLGIFNNILHNKLLSFLNYYNYININYLETLFYIIIGVTVYLLNERNNWIQKLNKNNKYKLLLYCFIISSLNLIIFNQTRDKNGILILLLYNYFPFSIKLISLISFISFIYFVKIIINTLISLPNTDYLIQLNNRLEKLYEINRIIVNSKNLEELFNKINEFSLSVSNGNIAWIEINNNKLNLSFKDIKEFKSNDIKLNEQNNEINNYVAQFNINYEEINLIKKNTNLDELIKNIAEPIIIDTFKKYKELNFIKNLTTCKALTAIPLFHKDLRFGNLIILHVNQYPLIKEDIKILSSFADNISIAIEQNILLQKSIETERYKNELDLAQKMQKKLLPQSIPYIEGFNIEAFCITAQEVGGDFYDFYTLKNQNKCVILCDVSGKGMTAAFVTAQLKGVAIASAPISNDIKEFIININNSLYSSLDKRTFVTITAIEFINTNLIKIIRAGHTPLVILRNKNKSSKDQNIEIETLLPRGFGIGLVNKYKFDDYLEINEVDLSQNESLVLYTDGLNEFRDINNNEFGLENSYDLFKNYKIQHNAFFDLEDKGNNYNIIKTQMFKTYLIEKLKISEGFELFDDLSVVYITKT